MLGRNLLHPEMKRNAKDPIREHPRLLRQASFARQSRDGSDFQFANPNKPPNYSLSVPKRTATTQRKSL